MFEELVDAATVSGAGALSVSARAENTACARKVAAMAAMLDAAYAADGSASRDQWCLDNFDAVAAHVGAALCITSGAAGNQLLIAVALNERFPKVAAVFAEGLITYAMVKTVVQRGALVVDPDALRALDAALATALCAGEAMSVHALEQTVDDAVARVDPQAVRRTQTTARDRSVELTVEDGSGFATLLSTLFVTDAKAFHQRLDLYAATVCPADPRTKAQRRADAHGAIGRGQDRLTCLCGSDDCPAATNPPAGGTVVYVIASQDTLAQQLSAQEPGPESGPPAPSTETAPPTETSAPPNDDADGTDDAAPNSDSRPPMPTPAPAIDEYTALDGERPPLFDKPLRDLTLTEALTPTPGYLATLRPAAMMGGHFLPGAIARRAAIGATLTPIVHPGQAPPENRYRPSKKLADFIRARDMTCRFPGCRVPATQTDLDHTIPWPHGPTAASNLKCVCRHHHLLKTFWGGENGWRDRQLDDGTIIWTAPDGREFVTVPGSRLLFPELSVPTATVTARDVPASHTAGLTMPRRRTTRTHDQADRVRREREGRPMD